MALTAAHVGDASFVDGFAGERVEKLIRCENDNDYPFLLRQLCNEGFMPSGPYPAAWGQQGNSEWDHINLQRANFLVPLDDAKYDRP